jgi:transposase-like protein
MDQVHVVRHKVLVEGQAVRRVAREMGIARNTVRKYLAQSEPVRVEKEPRARPVREKVVPRIEALLEESPRWTGCQRSASRDPLRPEIFSLKGPPVFQQHGTPARGA